MFDFLLLIRLIEPFGGRFLKWIPIIFYFYYPFYMSSIVCHLVLVISYHLYSSSGSVDMSVSVELHYLINSCSHEVISVDNHTFINPILST